MIRRYCLLLLLFLISNLSYGQEPGIIAGTILDQDQKAVPGVTIGILGEQSGTISDEQGNYKLHVQPGSGVLVFNHLSFQSLQKKVNINPGDVIQINVTLIPNVKQIKEVIVEDKAARQLGLQRLDPKLSVTIPTAGGGIEALLKTMPGVNSNNELSSQYSVRGGNYDENLVYVNDIEVYRPFLVRSGQQEGLSFINSDMVSGIKFSAGGFEAKYGDKMSSVLDITYRKPKETRGTVTASILGGGLHYEGSSKNARFTHMTGMRYRTTRYLLNSLDTRGEYNPSFGDIQTFLSYDFNPEWEINFLGNYAQNGYEVVPTSRKTEYGTISEALRFTVFFDGKEKDIFRTATGATSLIYKPQENIKLKWITSYFNSKEKEAFTIEGAYRLEELETDFGKETFGNVKFNRGIGGFIDHARNNLEANVFSTEHKGSITNKFSSTFWGVRFQHEEIDDRLNEWKLIDSAGYSIPQSNPDIIELPMVTKTTAHLNSNRYTSYFQKVFHFSDSSRYGFAVGARTNYWDLNKQFLVSPRASFSYRPDWKRDFLFRASSGIYYQPPFYRELRNIKGELNRNIKAQQSIHFLIGTDYNFTAWRRPFKLIAEAYYKKLDNLIPYEIDNVRIRYYAKNMAEGFATGFDMKVNGEFVKGIESWASLSFMRTMEDIVGDSVVVNFNREGAVIIPGYTFNDTVHSSVTLYPKYIPRPTDQRVSFSIFFQDYVPKVPSAKMHLNLVFGTALPFGPPDFQRYKDVLRTTPYRRVDIGFSYQLKKEEKVLPVTNPFHKLQSVWVSCEVFNILQIANTISYTWVQDITGRQYAIPNYLTGRLINIKLQAKF